MKNMKKDKAPSLSLASSSLSVYLLGQKQTLAPSLKRFQDLKASCLQHGEWLDFDNQSEWLTCYGRDSQNLHDKIPLSVFRPYSIHDISPVLKSCYEKEIAVTTRCGGTGLAGSSVPPNEGLVILTQHLRDIRSVDPKNGIFFAEPGVTLRQLKRKFDNTLWSIPLEMASEGVAGLGGILSANARGYHQQRESPCNWIESVSLVTGNGEVLWDVPSHLVCGMEGLLGVIIELKLHLKKKAEKRVNLVFTEEWGKLKTRLPLLQEMRCVKSLFLHQGVCHMQLEGEPWRVHSSLKSLMSDIKTLHLDPAKGRLKPFIPRHQRFMMISSLMALSVFEDALLFCLEQTEIAELNCQYAADMLTGTLHVIIEGADPLAVFSKKIEQFLVIWVDFLDRIQGQLVAVHGIGLQLGKYLTPFWTEERQRCLRAVQMQFDPKSLFSQHRFFPVMGKRIEKVKE